MKINSKNFGLSVAITAAFLWSFYSVGNLCLDIVFITFIEGTIYGNLSNFNWAIYANNYLILMIGITLVTGVLGWLIAEIYNELEGLLSIKLK